MTIKRGMLINAITSTKNKIPDNMENAGYGELEDLLQNQIHRNLNDAKTMQKPSFPEEGKSHAAL
jgi:hypothetical protein